MNNLSSDKRKNDNEFDRVCDLLTPKYSRKNNFTFMKQQKSLRLRLWGIGSIAAMVAVIVAVAAKTFTPVSATEIINDAITQITTSENVKVEFTTRAIPRANDEIYRIDPRGDIVNGTLYILRDGDAIYNRIDWDDARRNSIIYTGTEYIHLENGVEVARHPAKFSDEFLNLLNLNMIKQTLGNVSDNDITTSGNVVTATSTKGNIQLIGTFRSDNKLLEKARAIFTAGDGDTITLIETRSIALNQHLPDSLIVH